MSKSKDMGVVGQGKEETQTENPQKTMQSAKISKCKKKTYKQITLACAHSWKNERQNPQRKMMPKKQKDQKAIERTNKREKLEQLASHCPKLLKDGLMEMELKAFTTSSKTPPN